MAHLPLPIVSLECYLNFESRSSEKHEFIDGYMVAMAGGSSAQHHHRQCLHCHFATNGRFAVPAVQLRYAGAGG